MVNVAITPKIASAISNSASVKPWTWFRYVRAIVNAVSCFCQKYRPISEETLTGASYPGRIDAVPGYAQPGQQKYLKIEKIFDIIISGIGQPRAGCGILVLG
jgi:hypothetical protein